METLPGILRDGIANLEGGMDSGKSPNMLPKNKAAYLENITVRGGFAQTRPGFRQIKFKYYTGELTQSESDYNAIVDALLSGKFQGAHYYDEGSGIGGIVVQSDGYLYLLKFQNNLMTVGDITVPSDPNPTVFARVYMEQAEQYLIVQDSQNKPIIFNGANSRRSDLEAFEVPLGSGPMAYGMGRLWVSKGRSYVAGDLFNGPTGVLKFTENEYILNGGGFLLPLQSGNITGMCFTAQADTSLGQGELIIGTPDAIFSNNVPINVTDWQNQTTPLQTIVMQTSGVLSHWSMNIVNSDLFYRSRDGWRSIIQARREFNTYGNVPVSTEMNRILDKDSKSLLKYVSGIVFDNRLLMTCLPQAEPNQCYFQGMVVLDFDLLSAMGQKHPPAYDGIWTGPEIYQVLKGRFSGIERAFMFCRSTTKYCVEKIWLSIAIDCHFTGPTLPEVTITGASDVPATASVLCGVDSILSIDDGGTGYAVNDVVVPGNDTTAVTVWNRPARFKVATIGGGGTITSLTIDDEGEYTATGEDLLFGSTNGSGAGFRVHIQYRVNGVQITNPGRGYAAVPAVGIACGEMSAFAVMRPENELWEISRDEKFDYPINSDGDWTQTDIVSILETPSLQFLAGSNAALAKWLETGRLHIDRLIDQVDFTLQYRPDQNPCWIDWYSWNVCAAHCGLITEGPANCVVVPSTWDFFQEQYRPRMMIPHPLDNVSDDSTLMPTRIGREFQARLQWEGFCRIKLLELRTRDIQDEVNPPVVTTETTCREVQCTC